MGECGVQIYEITGLTRDRGVAGSSLTGGTALCPYHNSVSILRPDKRRWAVLS